MNILYLHGLLSKNISDKTEWLSETNNLYNLQLDYKTNSENIYQELKQFINNNPIDLIIGSSMGGYLAFHLGNDLNIPTLLFNPSLTKNKIEKPVVTEVKNISVLHTLVLGKGDEIVNPLETIDYCLDGKYNFKYTFENIGHRTPIDVLKKHFTFINEKF